LKEAGFDARRAVADHPAQMAQDRPLIIAHRGASFDAPENTLGAFRLAFEQGADGIEADFFLTTDGRIVAIHDPTTARTCAGADREVCRCTLAELQELDAGTWKDPKFSGERIPTIEQVLEFLPPDKVFLIEIKCGIEIVAPLAEVLRRSTVTSEQLRIMSFDQEVVRQAKRFMPHVKAFWLVEYERSGTGWEPTLDAIVRTCREIGADGVDTQANPEVMTKEFVRTLQSAGLDVSAWTIDDPIQAATLAAAGVQFITTNRPGFLRQSLKF
jgi:glycerophosphoryl diester phosphodiesterase